MIKKRFVSIKHPKIKTCDILRKTLGAKVKVEIKILKVTKNNQKATSPPSSPS